MTDETDYEILCQWNELDYLFVSGVRPFGVSLLVAGWDEDVQKPYLYQCDPSVCCLLCASSSTSFSVLVASFRSSWVNQFP